MTGSFTHPVLANPVMLNKDPVCLHECDSASASNLMLQSMDKSEVTVTVTTDCEIISLLKKIAEQQMKFVLLEENNSLLKEICERLKIRVNVLEDSIGFYRGLQKTSPTDCLDELIRRRVCVSDNVFFDERSCKLRHP